MTDISEGTGPVKFGLAEKYIALCHRATRFQSLSGAPHWWCGGLSRLTPPRKRPYFNETKEDMVGDNPVNLLLSRHTHLQVLTNRDGDTDSDKDSDIRMALPALF